MGSSDTKFLEFLRTGCARNLVLYKARWSIAAHGNLKNSTTGVSAHENLRYYIPFLEFCAPGAPKNLVPYKALSIAALGTLKNSNTGVSAHGNLRNSRGGGTRLPKFKFSAKFPIGLHVILQIQIRKFENDCYIMWKIILPENPSRFNVEPLLK